MVSILPSFFPCLSTGGRLPPHFSFCCSSSFSWPLRSLPSISGAIFAILPPFFGWGASSLFLLRSHLHFSSLFRGSSTVFLLPDDPLIRPFRILIHFSSACYSHSRLFPLCLSFLSVEFKKKNFYSFLPLSLAYGSTRSLLLLLVTRLYSGFLRGLCLPFPFSEAWVYLLCW